MKNNIPITILLENEKEWRRYLVDELKDIKTEQIEQGKNISSLNVKAGFFGMFGGILTTIGAFLIKKI